jgi:hypothetical protein
MTSNVLEIKRTMKLCPVEESHGKKTLISQDFDDLAVKLLQIFNCGISTVSC